MCGFDGSGSSTLLTVLKYSNIFALSSTISALAYFSWLTLALQPANFLTGCPTGWAEGAGATADKLSVSGTHLIGGKKCFMEH